MGVAIARDRWYWCIRDEDSRVVVMNLARPESEWMEVTVMRDGRDNERAAGNLADRLVDLLNGRIIEPDPTPESDAVHLARGYSE